VTSPGDMEFNIPGFRAASSQIAGQGQTAATTVSEAVTTNLVPILGASPFEAATGVMAGQLQGVLSPKGPALGAAGSALDGKTQAALSAIDAQDATNAARFPNASAPSVPNTGAANQAGDAATAAGDAAADTAGTAGELDPDSIDQEARDKAEQMLGGDQITQQMGQMAGQAAQAAAQAGQQLSQQFNQVGQQLGQGLQQAGQQLGQLVGKATQGVSGNIATPDLGLDSLGGAADIGGGVPDLGGAGGVPDFGGGAGDFGGGGGIGDVGGIGDGLGAASAAGPGMTTSPALVPSPLTPPGGGAQNNSATRVPMTAPMMPMMPMAARGSQGQNDNATKRDPIIFAERPLYEPPEGVEQVIGARPEIESEEPPFGADGEAAGR